jgi:hypothetical protein
MHARVIGAALTITVHGALCAPLFFAESSRETVKRGIAANGVADDTVSAWVLIGDGDSDSSSTTRVESEPFEVSPESVLAVAIVAPFIPPEALFELNSSESETPSAAGLDHASYLAMYGRYTAQASARVERAWIRPRNPVVGEQFQCTVRIDQGPGGEVQSTELMNCNGDSRWQESLVFAIERSSPLPAPPDPAVFTSQLVLTFSAAPYIDGISREEAYEPARRLANNP